MASSQMSTLTSEPLPATEPLDVRCSGVRFEPECVVIPDPAHRSRRPRVVTKTYTLPLWRRRASLPCPTPPPSEDGIAEDNQSHVVLRLPLPTLSLKSHTMARSIDHTPLPPCLVHRARSSVSCDSTPSLVQHTPTSRKPSRSPSRTDIITVPLRPCCVACEHITDAAFVGGDTWPEHFSRAASRRRSMSADCSSRAVTVAGSAASPSYGNLGVSIHVDEVDKRRRPSDSTADRETHSDCSSNGDAFFQCSPARITPATPRIPEEQDDDENESENENENELFPLPSPKRTPTPSPVPSPAGSLSSLTVTQTNQGSATSPPSSTCSGDSGSAHGSKRQYLAPPPCSSSSSLSLPRLSELVGDMVRADDLPLRAPSPSLLSTLPTLSGRSRPPSPPTSFTPLSPADMPSYTNSTLKVSQSPEVSSTLAPTAGSSSPRPSQLSASPYHSPGHVRFPWRSKRSFSADVISTSPARSPSTSPTIPPKNSLSKGTSRPIIADMLRGMGSGGIVPGVHL